MRAVAVVRYCPRNPVALGLLPCRSDTGDVTYQTGSIVWTTTSGSLDGPLTQLYLGRAD